MPIAHAMWIHGHSLVIEHPGLAKERILGGYIRIEGNAHSVNWVHGAIPTPVFVEDNRLSIDSVMLRFRTRPGSSVSKVHIYDGAKRIATHDNLNLTPDSWSFERFDVPGKPLIYWGLGISFKVNFLEPSTNRRIEISSVGADFLP